MFAGAAAVIVKTRPWPEAKSICDNTSAKFALVNSAQARRTSSADTFASRPDQRAVPMQDNLTEKDPGQRTECKVRAKR
jgi:hypothetical protein